MKNSMLKIAFLSFTFALFSSESHALGTCSGMSDCPRGYDCYWGKCCKIRASGGGLVDGKATNQNGPGQVDTTALPADLQQLLKNDPGILLKYPSNGPAPVVNSVSRKN